MFTLNSKQHFPETTRHENDEVDWQIMRRAINHIVPETLWIMPGDKRNDYFMPVARSGQPEVQDSAVRLVTKVRHAVKHREESGDPHRNHHAFEIDTVAHMRLRNRYFTRAVENRVNGFIQCVELAKAPTLIKVRLEVI